MKRKKIRIIECHRCKKEFESESRQRTTCNECKEEIKREKSLNLKGKKTRSSHPLLDKYKDKLDLLKIELSLNNEKECLNSN